MRNGVLKIIGSQIFNQSLIFEQAKLPTSVTSIDDVDDEEEENESHVNHMLNLFENFGYFAHSDSKHDDQEPLPLRCVYCPP